MTTRRFIAGAVALACLATVTSPANSATTQCGQASWYSAGTMTASGQRMDANRLAAAHRTLPFGTQVRVENLANGETVVVTINDRGPFIAGRVIDLTRGAAQEIGMINAGVVPVRITVLGGGAQLPGCT
ncbi:MAG: septal ring lytic transglycosylase RlpA family protein [Bauldia sp.]|jgi:rare lipoprotein A